MTIIFFLRIGKEGRRIERVTQDQRHLIQRVEIMEAVITVETIGNFPGVKARDAEKNLEDYIEE